MLKLPPQHTQHTHTCTSLYVIFIIYKSEDELGRSPDWFIRWCIDQVEDDKPKKWHRICLKQDGPTCIWIYGSPGQIKGLGQLGRAAWKLGPSDPLLSQSRDPSILLSGLCSLMWEPQERTATFHFFGAWVAVFRKAVTGRTGSKHRTCCSQLHDFDCELGLLVSPVLGNVGSKR